MLSEVELRKAREQRNLRLRADVAARSDAIRDANARAVLPDVQQSIDLLCAYKEIQHSAEFAEYIRYKATALEEGATFDALQLANDVEIIYRGTVEDSDTDYPIMAMNSNFALLSKQMESAPSKPNPKQPKSKKKTKSKGGQAFMDKLSSLPPPAAGEPHVRMWGDDQVTFCTKHQAWGSHTTASCQGRGLNKSSKGKPLPRPPPPDAKALAELKALAYDAKARAYALAGLVDDDDDSE
jgi:hypothetical protein